MEVKGIVRSVTEPKEWIGKMQIGFTLEADPKKFYNVDGEVDVLNELKKAIVSRGNEIKFEYDKGMVGDLTLVNKAKPKEGNWADDMTNFEDLLTAAHEKGLISINTELIQIDPEKKFAVFKAIVTGRINAKNGELGDVGSFTGYGDAEGISNETIKPHWIRMAETRSIVRALRFYTNNAQVAIEETDSSPIKKNETDTKKRG